MTVPFLISRSLPLRASPPKLGETLGLARDAVDCEYRREGLRARARSAVGGDDGSGDRNRSWRAPTPAQCPFLDAVPGQPGGRQGDAERPEKDLPPRGTATRQPHDQLLRWPAIDVNAVG